MATCVVILHHKHTGRNDLLVSNSNYDHIIVCTKSQLDWLKLSQPILPLPVTAKQRVVIITGDQPEQGIDGYALKDFERRKVLRRQ